MSNDNKPAAAQEAVAIEVPAGAIHNGRAFADRLESYRFECEGGPLTNCTDYVEFRRCFEHLAEWASALPELYAAPVAAAPVDLDEHGLRALDTCIADLRRLLELAPDYDLDVMQMQSLETAIESMELRKVASTPAAPGIDGEAVAGRGDAEIVAQTEQLARLLFAEFYGREAPESWLFREAEEPRSRHVWTIACKAQELLTDTDPENAVAELDDAPQLDASPKGGSDVQMVPYQRALDLLGDAYNAGTHGIGYSQQAMELCDAAQATTPKGGNTPAPRFELTNGQIAQLADFAGTPTAGEPLEDQDVLVIQHAEAGHSGPGLYAHYDELPEEGAIYLDGQFPGSPKEHVFIQAVAGLEFDAPMDAVVQSASHKGGCDVRESIASAIAELESPHVQNNKFRMGCLGADNIDSAVRLLTALQATSPKGGESMRDWSLRMAKLEEGQHVGAGAHGLPDSPKGGSDWDFTADEVNEVIDAALSKGTRLIPVEAIEQMRAALLQATSPKSTECGGCGNAIQSDPMTGTTCACATSPKGGSDAQDAARYRWLRDRYDPSVHDDDGDSIMARAGAKLDAAIDAELQATSAEVGA